ncbi:MAG: malto-oligosyltrehalose synthase, partial [Stellaceae bacterium]
GLRVELPALFADTHRLIFALVECGDVDGLRIDHIDGLFDPGTYAATLRAHAPAPAYLIVEKILARYETLPPWPIDGSTGYDFINEVLGLFVDADAEGAITRLYQRLTGRTEDFDAVLYASKRRIMRVNLSSEMNVLAQCFHRLSMHHWRTRDFTVNGMLAALQEVIAAFPVYRTYVSPHGVSDNDRRYIGWAVAQAKKRWRAGDTSILDFIHGVLTAALVGGARRSEALRAAMQFQQASGPVMAKAAEDTAFYRYFRLLALNEVGGDPRRFGQSIAAFHHAMRDRARDWPCSMLATATHDTKRGEDARVRLAMLSEMPRLWGRYVSRWLRLNRSRRAELGGEIVPDRNVEYLFYQTLVGAWPPGLDPGDAVAVKALAERVGAYMIKAVREGKEESGWSNPNVEYEAALEHFVTTVLDGERRNAFLTDFTAFIRPLARLSAISSLAQLVLKLTAPGIPDLYQGCELWDFSLVDPDNRRAPDWALRRNLLAAVAAAEPGAITADWHDGRAKLAVTRRLLQLRAEQPALFAAGDYTPLAAEGARADHLCAFVRRHDDAAVVVAVPRLVYRLHRGGDTADWGATELPIPGDGAWHNLLSGHTYAGAAPVLAAELLAGFPAAVLVQAGAG